MTNPAAFVVLDPSRTPDDLDVRVRPVHADRRQLAETYHVRFTHSFRTLLVKDGRVYRFHTRFAQGKPKRRQRAKRCL